METLPPNLPHREVRQIVMETLEEGFREFEINPWITTTDELGTIYYDSILTPLFVRYHWNYQQFVRVFKRAAKKFRDNGCHFNI